MNITIEMGLGPTTVTLEAQSEEEGRFLAKFFENELKTVAKQFPLREVAKIKPPTNCPLLGVEECPCNEVVHCPLKGRT
jgi:hypothetical protein